MTASCHDELTRISRKPGSLEKIGPVLAPGLGQFFRRIEMATSVKWCPKRGREPWHRAFSADRHAKLIAGNRVPSRVHSIFQEKCIRQRTAIVFLIAIE